MKENFYTILTISIIYLYRVFNTSRPSFIIIIKDYRRDKIFEITFAFFILYRTNKLNIDKY